MTEAILRHRTSTLALKLFTLGSARTAARYVCDRLQQVGMPMARGSRIERVQKSLSRLIERLESNGHATVDRVRYAEDLRTAIEQYLIVRAVVDVPGTLEPALLDRLTSTLSGADSPREDSKSGARDSQFELAVASLLTLGGVRRVHWGEPDLRVLVGAEFIGVAIKRLSSVRQLEKRVKEASRQVRQQGRPGIVVLGLDRPLERLAPYDADGRNRELTRSARQIIAKYQASDLVVGVLGIGLTPIWDSSGAKSEELISSCDERLTGLQLSLSLELIAPEDKAEQEQLLNFEQSLSAVGRNLEQALHREADHLACLDA